MTTHDADPPRYEDAIFVNEGETVWAPWELFCPAEERADVARRGVGVRCTVAVAAGEHARIVCEKRGIDRWVSIRLLRKRAS